MKLSRPLPLIRLILTKLKQADFTERGLGQYFFLLAFSWRPSCYAKETAEQNSKFQETSFTLYLLFISIVLYYKSHFRQTCHLYSRAPLRVSRTCMLLAVFLIKFYPIQVMSKSHLVEGSGRSNNIFTTISSEISA